MFLLYNFWALFSSSKNKDFIGTKDLKGILRQSCTLESLEGLIKWILLGSPPEFLIQHVWDGAENFFF